MGMPRQCIRTWPRGWPLCHGISGILDLSQGDLRYLPQCLFLRRPPGLPPCEDQWRRRAICDILSSLTSQLHQHGYPAATGEDQESKEEWLPRPSRRELYEEVLRVVHQRALETAEVLWGDIERLSWGMGDAPWTSSGSHSRSCTRSWGRSQSRSHSKAHSQSHPRSGSWSRQPGSPSRPQFGREVTFREPEVELDPEGGEENYLPEPPISDVETWLDWQACQLSTPTWWLELRAILGEKDPLKLTHKIWASFSIPKVRMRAFLGQDYTVPLPSNASTGMPSFQMNYHTRMYGSNLFS